MANGINKRSIIIQIFISLIIIVFTSSTAFAYAKNEAPLATYDDDEKVAEYYYSSDLFSKYLRNAPYYPYQKYIGEMEKETGFEAAYALWRTTNFAEKLLGGDVEGSLEEAVNVEYYEMVLYDLLFGSNDTEAFYGSMTSILKSNQVKAADNLIEAYKIGLGLDDYDIGLDISTDKDNWDLVLSSAYTRDVITYKEIFGSVSVMKKLAKGAETIDQVANKIAILQTFNYMKKEYTLFLHILAEECDDSDLKAAIYDMCTYFDNSFSTEYIIEKEVCEKAFREAVQWIHKDLYTNMAANLGLRLSIPELVYKTGKCLLNSWLSIDQKYETYAKMTALRDIEIAYQNAAIKCVANYKNTLSTDNARALNACVDFGVKIASMGYEFSEEYYSVMDESGLNSVMEYYGYYSYDFSDVKRDLQAKRHRIEQDYNLSQIMLSEVMSQGKKGYDTVFGNYYTIESVADFETICTISSELYSRDQKCISKLKVLFDGEVSVDKDVHLGSLNVKKLNINGASVNLSGNALITSLCFDSAQLFVEGDAQVGGIAYMKNESDLLHVRGNFTIGNYHSNVISDMTAGTVELEGDMTFRSIDQSGGMVDNGYAPKGTCKTVFCGDGLQTVSGCLHYISREDVNLGDVEIRCSKFEMKPSSNCSPDIRLLNDVIIDSNTTINAGTLDLNGHTLTTKGSVNVDSKITMCGGSSLITEGGLTAGEIATKQGAVTLGGPILAKSLTFDNSQVTVKDDIHVGAIAYMHNDNDLLHVCGDFTVGNFHTHIESDMTAGTVELEGDMKFWSIDQSNGLVSYGYRPQGTCKTVFCGDELQTVRGYLRDSGSYYVFRDVNLGDIEIRGSKFTMDLEDGCAPDINILNDVRITEGGNIECNNLILSNHDFMTVGKLEIANKLTTYGDVLISADKGVGISFDGDSESFGRASISAELGTLTIRGNTEITTISLYFGTLICEGDLSIEAFLGIQSNTDRLKVTGDLTVWGSHKGNTLSGGIIELCSDLKIINEEGLKPRRTVIAFIGNDKQKTEMNWANANTCAIVNTHANESDFVSKYSNYGTNYYIYDPDYKTGDKYIEIAKFYADGDYTYDGASFSPEIALMYVSKILVENQDYVLDFEDYDNGIVTLLAKGIGDYKGCKRIDFSFVQNSIEDATIDLIEEVPYAGRELTPRVEIKFNDNLLVENKDYTLSYSNNIKPGIATVTITGLGFYTGTITKSFEIVSIPCEEHHFGEWYVTQEATCISKGLRERFCSACGETETEELPAIGHQWNEDYTVDKEASCIEEGSKSIHCSKCNEVTKVTAIPALGHSFSEEFTVDQEPTCTVEGSKSKHCLYCDETTEVTVIPANGHTFGDWVEITPSTCENKGLKQRTCEFCGTVESENLDANGHDWENDLTVDLAATCTQDGSQSRHCKSCDAVIDSQVIPANGHTYGDWSTTKEASCDSAGSQEKTCSACSDKVTEEIPALGHAWNDNPTIDKAATCTEDGSQSIHCSRCNETKDAKELPALGHNFSEWSTTKEATEIAEGQQTRVCSLCGETETQSIAQLKPTLPKVTISKPKAEKKAATVKWKKVSKKNLKKIAKIEIQYSTSKDFSTDVKTKYASAKKTSYKIKSLKKGKKYYIRIRAYKKSGGVVHVSNWSSIKYVKAK